MLVIPFFSFDFHVEEEQMLNILTREGSEKLSVEEARTIISMFDKDEKGGININGNIFSAIHLLHKICQIGLQQITHQ